MEIRRLWKRESHYHKKFKGRFSSDNEHIKETVHIDISETDSTVLVKLHSDDTLDVFDILKWGSIRMNRSQAERLLFELHKELPKT